MKQFRFGLRAAIRAGFFVAALGAVAGPVFGQNGDDMRRNGHALLEKHCGDCHAIEATGESKHHLAPPFRTLGQRYAIESLEEALAEGIVSGHPDMPEFKFKAEEVGAIIAYLKSLPVSAR